MVELYHGDCLDVMPTLPENSIDAIVCDPPYGLSFMGKNWDHGVPGVPFWKAALRVAKPGAHLLAFGGTRTHHRLMVAIEDAGWEIRDCLMWLYGSGFPKSHDISKAIDKAAGAEREVIGLDPHSANRSSNLGYGTNLPPEGERFLTAPATDAAKQWDGWGTSLKPAWESIIVAQKPNPSLTQEQLFAIMSIVNFQLLMEITLCQAKVQSSASNAESHLRHLAQKSKEVAQNTALSRVWEWPNEGELSPFVVSAAQHLSDTLVGLEKMRLNIVPESVKQSINERLPANLTLTGVVEDLCGLMAILLSELETHTDLSMISSWSSTLVAALNLMNRFTTTTAIEAITVLRTLNWSLFQSISESITLPRSAQTNGYPSPVEIAVSHLSGARESMSAILTSIAAANATASIGRLRPNWEPIILAMKPLDGTFANNALKWGVAGINVDACRIEAEPELAKNWQRNQSQSAKEGRNAMNGGLDTIDLRSYTPNGRWPANVLLDEKSAALLDQMSGESKSKASMRGLSGRHDAGDQSNQRIKPYTNTVRGHNDTGGASRFFYVAKASRADRGDDNTHSTVKPTQLMRYLVRLVTPPNGTILDPFMGSGSTGKAAKLEGFNFVGIELDEDYYRIAEKRIAAAQAQLPLLEITA